MNRILNFKKGIVYLSHYSMSVCLMKNRRELTKKLTFEKIIQSTKELIIKKGIVNLKTLDVTKRAEVAHGTLFSHFATKEFLISEICQIELKRIAIKLREIIDGKYFSINMLLESYIMLIAENEEFYAILAKEFPFLNESIQRSIIANETIVRNILYQKIENGIKNQIYNVLDITMAVSFFFATINYYLCRKEYFISGSGKLMVQKKNQIITTFLQLLNT